MATTQRFMEDHKIVNLLVPVSDVFATNVTTEEVNMAEWNHCSFVVITGANASSDEPAFVVESCSDASGSNNTAIGFDYTATPGAAVASRNNWADYTTKTSAGYQTNPASAVSLMHCIEVDAAELSVTSGVEHEYVRLVITESGSTGITGCVIAILSDPRYAIDPVNQTNVLA